MTTWQEIFRRVPRHWFVPETVWTRGEDGFMVPLRRTDNPDRWLELCNDPNEAIVTQVDGGAEQYGIVPTSSSSAPDVMADMLDALDVEPGMRVLEIGTGTGYNAAVLAERVGAARITTVEADPAIAEHANTALRQAGYPATVITGDGADGYPPHAPYDRVIATAAATHIPYAWVEQSRPGGRIVLPWTSTFAAGALLALTVRADGSADGGFTERLGFMRLRGQRTGSVTERDDTDSVETTTLVYPHELFDDDDLDADFAIGALLPGCQEGHIVADGVHTLRLVHPASGSRAEFTSGAHEHRVSQEGPRRLWDELAEAYRWWTGAGRPDRTRFGLAVTPEGQWVWLDEPDGPSWELPG